MATLLNLGSLNLDYVYRVPHFVAPGETLALIDRAYIIHSGHVLTHGTTQDIISNPDVRRLYLGQEFRM